MTQILEGKILPPISQQDTYDHIFGSCFDMYGWWGTVRPEWDQREPAPHGWSVLVPVRDADRDSDKKWRTTMVTHSVLMGAIRRIADGSVHKYVPNEAKDACKDFLQDPESADFDADSADVVMQVACLNEVAFC